jgi:hypothetical protein
MDILDAEVGSFPSSQAGDGLLYWAATDHLWAIARLSTIGNRFVEIG